MRFASLRLLSKTNPKILKKTRENQLVFRGESRYLDIKLDNHERKIHAPTQPTTKNNCTAKTAGRIRESAAAARGGDLPPQTPFPNPRHGAQSASHRVARRGPARRPSSAATLNRTRSPVCGTRSTKGTTTSRVSFTISARRFRWLHHATANPSAPDAGKSSDAWCLRVPIRRCTIYCVKVSRNFRPA